MNAKKIFSVLLLLFGEALIIICYLHFGRNLASDILTLNIVVTSIIFLLWYIEKFVPMINLKDKSQKDVGTLGLKWLFAILYTIFAIGVMLVCNTMKPMGISTQIIFHAILLFLLLVGLYFMNYTSEKVLEVYKEETSNRSRIDEMKKTTKEVVLKLGQMKNISNDITSSINTLYENLRFISPSKNEQAIELEANFLNEMRKVHDSLFDTPLNNEKIIENIQNCEQIYKERKRVFSN